MAEEHTDFGQRFNELRKKKHLVDCSFRVNDDVYHCHKLILSAASPVFETMFYGALAEKQMVKIADIKPNVFERMLEYIYVGAIDFDGVQNIEELLELYYCAEKYMIDSLHEKCVNYFGKNIKPNNVLKILDIAYPYGKCKQLLVNFSENMYVQNCGSILNGIVCDLYK
uniref:BTB domain-containing protein n=1 Tax=Anopheles farauti TaxID=69004 RepID=A0A182QR42_9DIPT